jgi:hypothetical protein
MTLKGGDGEALDKTIVGEWKQAVRRLETRNYGLLRVVEMGLTKESGWP